MSDLTIRDVPGIRVGHWTDTDAGTGCTVVLGPDDGMMAGVDVRGAAPGTRETDLLRPTALVERINAICLAGGSAFGLAAADGVMRRLAERGVGFPTGIRPVPIVPAAILFDLAVGDPQAYPDAEAGWRAARAAETNDGPIEGRVGAGTGATVAKLGGPGTERPGGVGSAARRVGEWTIGTIVVNNALGAIHARDGGPLVQLRGDGPAQPPVGNTVLVVVATDAPLDRVRCRRLSELAHDALARAVRPAHTMWDGDVAFTVATGDGSGTRDGDLLELALAADDAIGEAIERSVSWNGAAPG